MQHFFHEQCILTVHCLHVARLTSDEQANCRVIQSWLFAEDADCLVGVGHHHRVCLQQVAASTGSKTTQFVVVHLPPIRITRPAA